MILSVGSRDSQLARQQAQYVIDLIEEQTDSRAELQTMESLGDQNRDSEPSELDEIGIFTSRLDQCLLNGEVDMVVHSLKDCPTERPENLELAAIPPRATPFDTLLGSLHDNLKTLDEGTVIGTSSERRRANLLYHNDQITVEPCRGNVPTRVDKLNDDDSKYDALVLAAAGLARLEISERGRLLRKGEMLPAAGQGALAVMCRSDSPEIKERIETINHTQSNRICTAERSFLNRLEGGCEAPIGALARISNRELKLTGSVLALDGSCRFQQTRSGDPGQAESIGRSLAESLLDEGAGEPLER
jgi:hydroxymethylbilane synthase